MEMILDLLTSFMYGAIAGILVVIFLFLKNILNKRKKEKYSDEVKDEKNN